MATNFEPNECVIFAHSTKIGTHENKAIHSNSYVHVGMYPLFALTLPVWRSMHYILKCSSYYLKYKVSSSCFKRSISDQQYFPYT